MRNDRFAHSQPFLDWERQENEAKVYVCNCFIKPRVGETHQLFSPRGGVHLDGYAIVPKAEYLTLRDRSVFRHILDAIKARFGGTPC